MNGDGMAGNAGNWYKHGPGKKGSVYIDSRAVGMYFGLDTPEQIAEMKATLRAPDFPAEKLAGLATYSRTPAGIAKIAMPKKRGGSIPQRSQADRDEFTRRQRESYINGYGGAINEGEVDAFIAKVEGIARAAIADSDLVTRVPYDVLSDILDSGFKNQHATSAGMLRDDGDSDVFVTQLRADAERNMFGIPAGSAPGEYPVYGYLHPKGVAPSRSDNAYMYGTVMITFKDSVRNRATVSTMDSLANGAKNNLMPDPLDSVTINSIADKGRKLATNADRGTKAILDSVRYFETQIHGPTTAADIAGVSFPKTKLEDSGFDSGALVTRLRQLGIEVSYY